MGVKQTSAVTYKVDNATVGENDDVNHQQVKSCRNPKTIKAMSFKRRATYRKSNADSMADQFL